jgi:hypothetical protein
MVEPRFEFFCGSQADDADGVFIGALCENHHKEAAIDHSDSNEAHLTIIEPVVFAFECGVPIEPDRSL